MTRHMTFPDGDSVVHEYAPDAPPMDEHGAMARVLPRVEPPESFIPAVRDARRDAVVAAAVAWRQEGDWEAAQVAQQRLADAIDRYTGGA